MDERKRLEPLLRPDETLHWTGRPDPKVHFSPADVFLIPFSLLWGGFALFWEYQVITSGAEPAFILFGIPFVFMGLYLIVGRFIFKSRRKRSTVYGLTESRAIVSIGDRSHQDAPIHGVTVSTKHSRNNSHVTVTFGSNRYTPYQNTGMGIFGAGQDQGIGFFDVRDPEKLTRTLNSLR